MVDAIVVGAGAAGLAAGATLGRAGVAVTVLESASEVGASWRNRYDGLRLNTPGWMSTQPGYRASKGTYDEFPTRDAWVQYLEDYAEHHRLRVLFDTEAVKVSSRGGSWVVETTAGELTARYGAVDSLSPR